MEAFSFAGANSTESQLSLLAFQQALLGGLFEGAFSFAFLSTISSEIDSKEISIQFISKDEHLLNESELLKSQVFFFKIITFNTVLSSILK